MPLKDRNRFCHLAIAWRKYDRIEYGPSGGPYNILGFAILDYIILQFTFLSRYCSGIRL